MIHTEIIELSSALLLCIFVIRKIFVDETDTLNARISRLELKVDMICQKTDINDGNEFDGVRHLINSNQKIQAIVLYRKITGVGLKEAKDAVDAMEIDR